MTKITDGSVPTASFLEIIYFKCCLIWTAILNSMGSHKLLSGFPFILACLLSSLNYVKISKNYLKSECDTALIVFWKSSLRFFTEQSVNIPGDRDKYLPLSSIINTEKCHCTLKQEQGELFPQRNCWSSLIDFDCS